MKICPNWMYCDVPCAHRKPHKCIVDYDDHDMLCMTNCSKADMKSFKDWDAVCSKCVRHKTKGCIDGGKGKKT
jgi:hypothetical protein